MTEKYGVIQYPSEPRTMNDLSCETNIDSFLIIESIKNYKLINVVGSMISQLVLKKKEICAFDR